MRPAQSSDNRRRRLRLIKTANERLATRNEQDDSPFPKSPSTNPKLIRPDLEITRARFFKECRGNASIRIQIERTGKSPVQLTLNRPYLLIGRDSSCDLVLNDPSIAPRHCYLQWISGRIFCCNLVHPGTVNSPRQAQPSGHWISRQPISVGSYHLTLPGDDASPPDFSPLDRSVQLANELPYLGLQFDGIEQAENVFPINRIITLIGTGPHCKLRLNHKSVADVHACLVRTESGCWLIDIANDGTTSVNGHVVRVSSIDIGDVIRLGLFAIHVVTTEFHSIVPFERDAGDRVHRPEKSFSSVENDRHPPKKDVTPDFPEVLEPMRNDLVSQSGTRQLVADAVKPKSQPCTENRPPDAVRAFVEQHRAQLSELKSRLKALQNVHDEAAGKTISQRTRDSLEKPMIDTVHCYEAMEELLTQFMQSHDLKSE